MRVAGQQLRGRGARTTDTDGWNGRARNVLNWPRAPRAASPSTERLSHCRCFCCCYGGCCDDVVYLNVFCFFFDCLVSPSTRNAPLRLSLLSALSAQKILFKYFYTLNAACTYTHKHVDTFVLYASGAHATGRGLGRGEKWGRLTHKNKFFIELRATCLLFRWFASASALASVFCFQWLFLFLFQFQFQLLFVVADCGCGGGGNCCCVVVTLLFI